MDQKKVSHSQRNLQLASKFAKTETYRLMSFSDGVASAEHIVRVTELEIESRKLDKALAAF